MLTAALIEVLPTFYTYALAVRGADRVHRHSEQNIIAKRHAKLNITIPRHLFFVKFLDHARFKNVQVFKTGLHVHRHWFQAAAAFSVNLCLKFHLQQQAFPRSGKSIFSNQVPGMQVGFNKNSGKVEFKISAISNRFIEHKADVCSQRVKYFFHDKLQLLRCFL